MSTTRRNFLKTTAITTAGLSLGLNSQAAMTSKEPLFKISLAEWSINRSLFKKKTDHLDFPVLARKHGIDAVEYVNQFFKDKAEDKAYLREMKARADGEGVRSVLIMCDAEGSLGAEDEKERIQTVENHKKWVQAAKYLGCHSIRVNGYSPYKWSKSKKDFKKSQKLVADGLRRMCEYADQFDINVMIENHGGFSSNAKWLTGVMDLADHPRAGTLPDFGNFRLNGWGTKTPAASYDAYRGVQELMPYAKGVSVKITAWDDDGNQSDLDYERMMKIVLDAGYRGYCGIEHGEKDREWESIVEVRDKLIATRDALKEMY
ncbi:MAG: sugar phosphate isomerase/epimerase family protein [Bacteroidota bacterium]